MEDRKSARPVRRAPKKRGCEFCKDKVEDIDYIALANEINKENSRFRDREGDRKDSPRRKYSMYVTEAGRIMPRRMTGVCAKHQRLLALAVKRARVMALLPFKAD